MKLSRHGISLSFKRLSAVAESNRERNATVNELCVFNQSVFVRTYLR